MIYNRLEESPRLKVFSAGQAITRVLTEWLEVTEMAEGKQAGYRVVGTIREVKGDCEAGHKVGDEIELSCMSSGGLCGYLYHGIFPYLTMLEFGGNFPEEWGDPEVAVLDCMDRQNTVTIELRRIRSEGS